MTTPFMGAAPPLQKGALVQYSQTMAGFVPNVVLFQYNPETVQHDWTQTAPTAGPGRAGADPKAVEGAPGERFAFTLHVNSDEDVAAGLPPTSQLAAQAGVTPRLAALEMMLYPTNTASATTASSLVGTLTAPVPQQDKTFSLPQSTAPFVILVMGLGRVVGVRLTSLSITETYFDAQLNPTHADVQISLDVLTPAELMSAQPDNPVMSKLATAAYLYTLARRQALGVMNLTDAGSAVLSLIPRSGR